ncbi:MAG: polymerase beta, Nucleotidyltransferase [Hyphomicrobiales bacterium]|jgi:predicted nucleotidyltransferase|nr:polymerase beta, Nucleotidyltransferase [Hyphomicrobiales bacterium]
MTIDDVRRLIDLDRKSLEASGVTALYVFGSLARGEAGQKSDVDVIVDYDPATFVWSTSPMSGSGSRYVWRRKSTS